MNDLLIAATIAAAVCPPQAEQDVMPPASAATSDLPGSDTLAPLVTGVFVPSKAPDVADEVQRWERGGLRYIVRRTENGFSQSLRIEVLPLPPYSLFRLADRARPSPDPAPPDGDAQPLASGKAAAAQLEESPPP